MASTHGFCTIHKIGYNRSLDPTCPQCTQNRMAPPQQLDFHPRAQKPIDPGTGNLLNPGDLTVFMAPDPTTAKPVAAASV